MINFSVRRNLVAISIPNFMVGLLDCNPPRVCKKKSSISSFFIPGFVTIRLRTCIRSDLSLVIFDSIGSGSPLT